MVKMRHIHFLSIVYSAIREIWEKGFCLFYLILELTRANRSGESNHTAIKDMKLGSINSWYLQKS